MKEEGRHLEGYEGSLELELETTGSMVAVMKREVAKGR